MVTHIESQQLQVFKVEKVYYCLEFLKPKSHISNIFDIRGLEIKVNYERAKM